MIRNIIACFLLGMSIGAAFLLFIGDIIRLGFTDNPLIGFAWMAVTFYFCYLFAKRISR